MKKYFVFAMVFVMLLGLTACGGAAEEKETVGLSNPFVTHETLEEAEKAAGFSMELPDRIPNWVSTTVFRTETKSGMMEVIYEGNEDELRIRKAPGEEDISGSYEQYEKTEEVTQGETVLTLKGNGEKYHLAIWQNGGYTYSVFCGQGMDKENLLGVIQSMQQ